MNPEGGRTAATALALAVLVLAVLVLALQWLLADAIDKRQRRQALRDLAALAAPVVFDNDPLTEVTDLRSRARPPGLDATLLQSMPLRDGDRQVALVVDARARGYLDAITLRVAFASGGRVLGLRVLEQRETAGLGDRLVSTDWLTRFVGSKAPVDEPRWRLRRDGGEVDQLTGATVTSRAALQALLVAASAQPTPAP